MKLEVKIHFCLILRYNIVKEYVKVITESIKYQLPNQSLPCLPQNPQNSCIFIKVIFTELAYSFWDYAPLAHLKVHQNMLIYFNMNVLKMFLTWDQLNICLTLIKSVTCCAVHCTYNTIYCIIVKCDSLTEYSLNHQLIK